jgi:hypothetical protein
VRKSIEIRAFRECREFLAAGSPSKFSNPRSLETKKSLKKPHHQEEIPSVAMAPSLLPWFRAG